MKGWPDTKSLQHRLREAIKQAVVQFSAKRTSIVLFLLPGHRAPVAIEPDAIHAEVSR